MMKNIQTYVTNSILCSLCFLFLACKPDVKVHECYYEEYNFSDSIFPYRYHATKIVEKEDMRQQISYLYYPSDNKKLFGKHLEYYKVAKDSVLMFYSLNGASKLYMSTASIDSCVVFGYNDEMYNSVAAITHCYKGEKKIMLRDGTSVDSYEFIKMYGYPSDVEYRVFYDKSFIPIREEWIEGGKFIPKLIIRINAIPAEFESLLLQEEDWVGFEKTMK